jgi:hypothetical protein
LPAQWLVGAKLVGRELRLEVGVELLQVEAALINMREGRWNGA